MDDNSDRRPITDSPLVSLDEDRATMAVVAVLFIAIVAVGIIAAAILKGCS